MDIIRRLLQRRPSPVSMGESLVMSGVGLATSVADDWKIAVKDLGSAFTPIWYETLVFTLRSQTAQITFDVEFTGLQFQLGIKVSKILKAGRSTSAVLDKTADVSDRMSQDWQSKQDRVSKQVFWSLNISKPFCANDVDWSFGTLDVVSLGVFEKALPGLNGADTVLHFKAANRAGPLFKHSGGGIVLDEGMLIPTAKAVVGHWEIA